MKKYIVAILIVILLDFSGCVNLDKNKIDNQLKDEIIIGINQDVFGFHPYIETLDVNTISVNKNIFNSLVSVDEIYRIIPELAISWNNPNNLTWRFFLREEVKFHNGYNFTAHDVKYSIELLKSYNSSVFNELLINIKNIEVVNNLTVDIITENPCPILLNKLIDILMVSKRYQENNSNRMPIGTGAYKYVNYVINNYIILERFDDYWNDKPQIKKVKFKIIEDSIDRKNALINNSIDIADTIYPEYYNELSSIEGLNVKNVNTPVAYYLSFDFRPNSSKWENGKNPFSYVEIRKAIYHSINIDEIINKHLYGFGTPISQFVSPLIFGYNPEIERLPYNLDISKQLMKDSGYISGFNVSLDCPDDALMKNISLDIINDLSEVNISVNLNVLSIYEWMNKINSKNTTFYLIGWVPSGIDGGEIFDYMLRSIDLEKNIGSFNAGYYSNSEVDIIGEEISSTMDTSIRQKLIQQGFAIAMDDIACIPLFSIQWIYGLSDDIYFIPRPDLNIRLEDIQFI